MIIALNGTNGYELWKTDGSTPGTSMVIDANPGTGHGLFDLNNQIFTPMKVLGNKVYYFATNGSSGFELWSSDGTAAGSSMVKDINPGPGDANYQLTFTDMVVMGNELYFPAWDGKIGVELWKSDGTAAGTVLVKDIHPITGSNPNYFCVLGNSLLFSALHPDYGRELWISDGTVIGTKMLNQICSGTCHGYPSNLTQNGNLLFFKGTETSTGAELYKIDLPLNSKSEIKYQKPAILPNPATTEITLIDFRVNELLIIRDIQGKELLNYTIGKIKLLISAV